jgi:hypothetical protein
MTAYDQGLRGHADQDIATICQREQRAVVSLDLDYKSSAGLLRMTIAPVANSAWMPLQKRERA